VTLYWCSIVLLGEFHSSLGVGRPITTSRFGSYHWERLQIVAMFRETVYSLIRTIATTTLAKPKQMSSTIGGSAIELVERLPLMHWKTFDPFLFCAYHKDNYPASAGNGSDYASLGLDPRYRRGRDIGSDFSGKDGFSMYHGEVVPGFPAQ